MSDACCFSANTTAPVDPRWRRLLWIASVGLFGSSTAVPNLILAAVMAMLGISGGTQIMRHTMSDLRVGATAARRSVATA